MTTIHPTASVDPGAELGEGVVVGAFTLVEGGVRIGDRTVLESHVAVKRGVTYGADGYVAQGAVIGGLPKTSSFGARTRSSSSAIGAPFAST